jgi:hypothetical protein
MAVVLDDALLARLASQPAVVLDFPELKPLVNRARRCCGNRLDTAPIKQAFVYLSAERKHRLRELLKQQDIRVYLRTSQGVRAVTL